MNVSMDVENKTAAESGPQYYIPDDVLSVLQVRYHIILPIFVCLAILVNSFCIAVTRRPKLSSLQCNIYIQMMASLDLMATIAYMPFIFDTELCLYEKYGAAFYFTHFSVHIPNCLRAAITYVMLSLSYDRFLAIWFPLRYKNISKEGILKKRFIFGGIWMVISFIPAMTIGNVSRQSEGLWLGLCGYKYVKSDWVFYYKMYLMLIIGILPIILIIGLNIGLVVGLCTKGITKLGPSNKRNRLLSSTVAVLAINISYVFCCVPYLLTAGFYNRDKGKCYSTYKTEMTLLIFNSMVLLWSIINILIFFLLNKDYSHEIRKMLECVPYIQNSIKNRSVSTDPREESLSDNPS
ncbi:unnamed protein product [Meganyctiphanes norvegica]|uniref:G-protein coupled receptors family 1 profile domain-containing protein n=1 Tax=Meganyctiphanes norvegica TaxID=48144 RepID=A0AAV2PRW9_MEGNR